MYSEGEGQVLKDRQRRGVKPRVCGSVLKTMFERVSEMAGSVRTLDIARNVGMSPTYTRYLRRLSSLDGESWEVIIEHKLGLHAALAVSKFSGQRQAVIARWLADGLINHIWLGALVVAPGGDGQEISMHLLMEHIGLPSDATSP